MTTRITIEEHGKTITYQARNLKETIETVDAPALFGTSLKTSRTLHTLTFITEEHQ